MSLPDATHPMFNKATEPCGAQYPFPRERYAGFVWSMARPFPKKKARWSVEPPPQCPSHRSAQPGVASPLACATASPRIGPRSTQCRTECPQSPSHRSAPRIGPPSPVPLASDLGSTGSARSAGACPDIAPRTLAHETFCEAIRWVALGSPARWARPDASDGNGAEFHTWVTAIFGPISRCSSPGNKLRTQTICGSDFG